MHAQPRLSIPYAITLLFTPIHWITSRLWPPLSLQPLLQSPVILKKFF